MANNEGISMGLAMGLIEGAVSPSAIEGAVSDWLDDHPEATTTVADGAVSYAKLDSTLKGKADAVASLSDEIDDISGQTYNLITNKRSKVTINNSGAIAGNDATDLWEAPIEEGKTYTITSPIASGASMVVGFFTAPISTVGVTTYDNTRTIIAPSNRYTVTAPINGYIGFISIADAQNVWIVEGDTAKDYVPPKTAVDYLARQDISKLPIDILDGKILCCCGDSITYGADMDSAGIEATSKIKMYQCNQYGVFSERTTNVLKTWGYQIASRNNMIFYNGGVSGSTVQGILDKYGFSLPGGRYTRLPDTIDYLLLWFGWNDTAYGTLGTIEDSTNASYYGAYNVVLPYLIDKYPYTKIGLIVPYGTDAEHRNAIRELGNKWGVAVWDNYNGGTPLYYGKEESVGVDQAIVTANRAKFQANGAHPNYKGHKQLSDMIENWIRSM